MRRLLPILFSLLAAAPCLWAQQVVEQQSGTVMESVLFPRDAAALGHGCMLMGGQSAMSAFGDPCGSVLMDGTFSASAGCAMHMMSSPLASYSPYAAFSYGHDGEFGMGFGFSTDRYLKEALAAGESTEFIDAPQPSSLMMGAGMSFAFFSRFALGANMRFLHQDLLGADALNAFAADLSLTFRIPAVTSLNLSVRNLGTKPGGFMLPLSVFGGGKYEKGFEFGKLSIFAEGELFLCGEQPGRRLSLGMEYAWNEMVFARLGGQAARYGNFFTSGLGFRFGAVALDVAYIFGNASAMAGGGSAGLTLSF